MNPHTRKIAPIALAILKTKLITFTIMEFGSTAANAGENTIVANTKLTAHRQ